MEIIAVSSLVFEKNHVFAFFSTSRVTQMDIQMVRQIAGPSHEAALADGSGGLKTLNC